MASSKSRSKTRGSEPPPGTWRAEWRHFWVVGVPLVAVLGTLTLGAALEVDSDAAGVSVLTPPTEPVVEGTLSLDERPPAVAFRDMAPAPAREEVVEPSPSPTEVRAEPRPETLVGRARYDAGRLAAAGPGWTLQYLLACDADNVRQVMSRIGEHEQLYLLPGLHAGRSCFRVCWGHFASRDRALAARSIPAPLAALSERPLPRPTEAVLP
ncbi:MAG: hypothetical protein GY716_13840 [bacterium]|nr:hypothetical protein [bacterium]